ncbi:MAG TPA: ATP-dependent Clp protease ATP-binding subunit [Thermoflexales bacterium]|nr:ATP-dependent Clp protease ATP-binding subunit [Thermoflexales bacterium]HQZ22360.1 ATP-dependent Clp protease ATP-binding subunit [Thermoflexales bacterium]HRA00805.1 ATP-dependent Clp protease ATP-binding subunit [Thermoflexales bacterium]
MPSNSLNTDLLDPNARAALSRAADLMRQFGKPVLMTELVLIALARMQDTTAYRILARLGETRGFKVMDVENDAIAQMRTRVDKGAKFTFVSDQGSTSELSEELLVTLDEARSAALATGEIYIATEHLLGALAQTGVSTAGLLQRRGVTPGAIASLMMEGVVSRRTTTSDWLALAKKGALEPLFFRDELLKELSTILALSESRHVILTGQPGSGRRSLARSLALLLAGNGAALPVPNLKVDSIIEVSDSAWLDNPTLAMQVGLRQAQGGVLFVSNIQRFFGRDPRLDAASKDLQKAFAGDEVAIVGSTTDAEFTDKLKANAIVPQNSHMLRVPPMTTKEAEQALNILRPQFERDYNVVIGASAPKTATALAARYIGDAPLPGSAVTVLHRACAVVRSSIAAPSAGAQPTTPTITAEDVTLAASMMTGIPVTKLGEDERAKFANIDDALRKRVLGQDQAIAALSRAVKSARVGLKDPKRPIGSFLFLGPSGVGKTELAKALAEFLFGSEDALVALDMSEYQKDDTINRLIGAPPGYVGYEGGGQLTEKIIKSPYAVVVFDEVEKAHPRILDILLQVMEEGRLTDGQGRVANFRETVILLTSNLGAKYLNDPALSEENARDLAMQDVREFFRPEFLNRLDDIVMFKPLPPDVMRKILDLMISKEAQMAAERGIGLEILPAARQWMLDQNNEPGMGARPLRRILQRSIREKLADYLLTLTSPPAKVIVDADASGLVFRKDL